MVVHRRLLFRATLSCAASHRACCRRASPRVLSVRFFGFSSIHAVVVVLAFLTAFCRRVLPLGDAVCLLCRLWRIFAPSALAVFAAAPPLAAFSLAACTASAAAFTFAASSAAAAAASSSAFFGFATRLGRAKASAAWRAINSAWRRSSSSRMRRCAS